MNQEIKQLSEFLAQQDLDLTVDEIGTMIEIPPERAMGDYAFPCYKLAKTLRKSPVMIAADLSQTLNPPQPFQRVEAAGPYINFFVDRAHRVQTVLDEILHRGDYGRSDLGEGQTVIVEFSSTNIAKPFHIGHLRSTVIGNALRNIYDKLGYDTIAINHLGDYGTQFGMMIAAYKRWGDMEQIRKQPIQEMLKLYVRFNQEAEQDPAYQEEARHWFKKLEGGDPEAVSLWQTFKDLSLKEFNRVYEMLGIHFDSWNGESFYSDKMDAVIAELEEKNLLVLSDGARIVELEEYRIPPALIQKSDGSTLYITRDLAAAMYRKKTYDFDKNLYVVGAPQALHFQQLFAVLIKMGHDWAKDCEHIQFGHIGMEEGAMSTRQGKVIFLEEVLNKAVEKTAEIIETRNPSLEDKETVARQVGIGAVIFQELFNNRIKDYVFQWDRTLSFEGETGPYVQYTHARACSVLEKAEDVPAPEDLSPIAENEEAYRLVQALTEYPEAIVDAMEKNEPYLLTRQILEIAKQFNKFYNTTPILRAEASDRAAYLTLLRACREVLCDGLAILGIQAPQKM